MTTIRTGFIGKFAVLACAAALVAACGTSNLAYRTLYEYGAGEHVRVELDERPVHTPPVLNVYLHRDDPSRALLMPSTWWALNHDDTGWVATAETQRQTYAKVLLKTLDERGRKCEIVQATPYIGFKFEFVVICAAEE